MTKIDSFYSKKFSSKNKYLVFTLLPTSITVAAVSSKKNKKPEIFFTVTETLIYEDKTKKKDFIIKYLKALDRACSRIAYKLDNDIENAFFLDSAFVFISDPWIESEIINLVDEKVTPFYINKEYLERIEKKDFYKNDFKNYISAKANGYDINFLDFNIKKENKIQKLELNILEQKIKNGFEEAVKKVIENNFVLSGIFFESSFTPILDIAENIFADKKDKIIINIYKEFTLMNVFWDSKFDSITKIPLGTNKILKEIKEIEFISDNNVAVNIFDKIRNNACKKEELKKIVVRNKKNYVSYINKALSAYKKYQISPNILLISSDRRSVLIDDEEIFGPNVVKVDYNFLNNLVAFSNAKYYDTHIALAVYYLFKKNNAR